MENSKRSVPRETFPGIDLSTRTSPHEVRLIRESIRLAMREPDPERPGKQIGTAKTAIYAFYDYDGEPIYVGQTAEGVSNRVGRHLTGMRSDAVAKFVLDPFEVYAMAVWSLPRILTDFVKEARRGELAKYEWTVLELLKMESTYGAVLNEGDVGTAEAMELPDPVVAVLIPDEIFPARSHPDVRIGRRAQTISLLANRIAERSVQSGIRRALVVQTRRLNHLAEERYKALGGLVEDDVDDDEPLENS
jgi:hypothetical protein